MYNCVGKIFEEAAEHRGRVLESRVDRGLSRHQVRKDVSIHEREEVFEVNGGHGYVRGRLERAR